MGSPGSIQPRSEWLKIMEEGIRIRVLSTVYKIDYTHLHREAPGKKQNHVNIKMQNLHRVHKDTRI